MKKHNNIRFISLVFSIVCFLFLGIQNLSSQNTKKNRLRLKASYTKIMDVESFIYIEATSKIEKQNTKVADISLKVFNEFDDQKIEIGEIKTDEKGGYKFDLNNLSEIKIDSTTKNYNIVVQFKGNEHYKKTSKSISFKDANIQAKLITKDSINYITASLNDLVTNSPIAGEYLNVQVQRLYNPLPIGEEFNETDENGTIIVPTGEGIPGVNGNLTFEVVLNDHDEYGTIKALIPTSIGTKIVDESSFDKRTMWSPRDKTPIFLLILTNLLIFVIWGIIIYLITNFIKINKS